MGKSKSKSRPVAILCSDLHLSHRAPVARSSEPHWYPAMARQLEELSELQESKDDIPIFCAGDIFDKWDSPAELINFALEYLPYMHCVPGQHDLPYHDPNQIEKSAFQTLVKAGKIDLLDANNFTEFPFDKPSRTGLYHLQVCGFPWGSEIEFPDSPKDDDSLHLAVAHEYIWNGVETSYTKAPKHQYISKTAKKLAGFDAAVFGDNHKGFLDKANDVEILNGGSFFRRTISEIDYRPTIGILMDDGVIEPYEMDVSLDQWSEKVSDIVEQIDNSLDISEFLNDLGDLQGTVMDFTGTLKSFLESKPKIRKSVQKIIREVLGK